MGLSSINSPSFSERFVSVLSLAGFVFCTSREPAVRPGVEQQLNTYTRTLQSFLLPLILDRQQNCVILIAYCVEALPCHILLFRAMCLQYSCIKILSKCWRSNNYRHL